MRTLANVQQATIQSIIAATIAQDSRVCTEEYDIYFISPPSSLCIMHVAAAKPASANSLPPRWHDVSRQSGSRKEPLLKSRTRHIAVDTQGLLLGIVVHVADIQDADGFYDLLKQVMPLYSWLRVVFADSIYNRGSAMLACFLFGLALLLHSAVRPPVSPHAPVGETAVSSRVGRAGTSISPPRMSSAP